MAETMKQRKLTTVAGRDSCALMLPVLLEAQLTQPLPKARSITEGDNLRHLEIAAREQSDFVYK
jgi:hypothetical protein